MPDLPLTRMSLLVRLKARSDDAWHEFLSIYEQALLDFSKRKGLQDADAMDVTQEVLAALEKKLPNWDTNPERGKLRGWLFRVARNMAIDKITERAKSPLAFGAMDSSGYRDLGSFKAEQSQEFLNQFRRRVFHYAAEQVRQRVNQQTWQAFWLTAMEGQSAEQVGQQLGLKAGNVYAAKFRVTSRIQKLVDSIDASDDQWKLPDAGEQV